MSNKNFKPSVKDIDHAPLSLPLSGRETLSWDNYSELLERHRVLAEENIALKTDISDLNRRLNTKEKLDALIKPYAGKSFNFMCVYCFVVAVIVVLDGFAFYGFDVADGVLEFLVGSTAVTVIGLVGMVLTGVFVSRSGR